MDKTFAQKNNETGNLQRCVPSRRQRLNHEWQGATIGCNVTLPAAVLCGGRELLSNVISTQIPLHRKFGSVVPEIDEALTKAGVPINFCIAEVANG